MVKEVHETLAAAEEALLRAEAVRVAAFHAVEKAREAVSLKAAGVAAELLVIAAEVAANAVRDAELKALEAWQAAAKGALEQSITTHHMRRAGDK
jgi:hypothetical protein